MCTYVTCRVPQGGRKWFLPASGRVNHNILWGVERREYPPLDKWTPAGRKRDRCRANLGSGQSVRATRWSLEQGGWVSKFEARSEKI